MLWSTLEAAAAAAAACFLFKGFVDEEKAKCWSTEVVEPIDSSKLFATWEPGCLWFAAAAAEAEAEAIIGDIVESFVAIEVVTGGEAVE